MTVIRASEQVNDAFFGYENLALSASSITATSESAGNPAVNLFNYFTFDGWQPDAGGAQSVDISLAAPAPVDYFAFFGQNGFDQAGATVTFSANSGGGFVDLATVTLLDNSPQMIVFNETVAASFRITVNAPNPFILNTASFGKALPIPYGLANDFNSPHNGQQFADVSNVSETGNFIGRSVRKEAIDFTVSSELLEYDWFIANWRPFLRHLELRPFWFKWSDTNYTDEAVFCWNNGKISTPNYNDTHFLNFSLNLKGLVS